MCMKSASFGKSTRWTSSRAWVHSLVSYLDRWRLDFQLQYDCSFNLTFNILTVIHKKRIPPIEYILQIGVSFFKVIVHSIRPRVVILGRLQGTNIFCNIKQYPMVCQTPAVLTTRIDTSFFCFINANFIRERYRYGF